MLCPSISIENDCVLLIAVAALEISVGGLLFVDKFALKAALSISLPNSCKPNLGWNLFWPI